MNNDITLASETIKTGGIILYPTDTIWGMGCDATQVEAVNKIFYIKQRSDSKSLILLVSKPEMIFNYVQQVPEIAWQVIDVAVDPLTIIYPKGKNLPANVMAADGSVAIRVVNDVFCRKLIDKISKPLVSTSANISDHPYPKCFSEINTGIINLVDYVVKWRQEEPIGNAVPSGIIKLGVNGEVQVIRK